MNFLKNIILLLLFLNFSIGYACSCVSVKNITKKAELEFNISTNVFSGYITYKNEINQYTDILIKEVFKGEIKVGQTIRIYFTDCEPYPVLEQTWLIYSYLEDGYNTIQKCGISRDLKNPEKSYIYNQYKIKLPLPDEPYIEETELEKRNRIIERRRKAKQELRNELIWLRSKKNK